MKKSLALLAALGCFSQSSMAATTNIQNLTTITTGTLQSNFRVLSEDFGAALSYKPVTPAAALGLTGFDVGIELSATDISKSASILQALTPGATIPGTLPVPKLTVAKGLPFGIDVSAFITSVPSTDIKVTGGAISYAILEGGMVEPALTVRAAMTRLSGISEYSLSTKSLDIAVSKGILGFTPYIGAGQVWVDSSTTNSILTAAGLKAETFTQSKVFAGLNFNLGLPNFAIEADQTGGIQTISAKLGLRW
ncbi:MAG: hypothetical protein Q8O24_09585 [Gallionellaceae bacterium]|nr:hypothetical protein [Gallionellaceae bacterium]